jgi:putative FmdB family regulatory protein
MPTYQYVCDNCGYEAEIRQSIKDDAITRCDKCKTENLRRIISGGVIAIVKSTGNPVMLNQNDGVANKRSKKRKKLARPWWRNSDKINTKILQNPRRYIETGEA